MNSIKTSQKVGEADDDNQQTFTTGTFQFSGADLNTLESTEYTLVGIALDTSMSIANFRAQLEVALKDVVEACQDSPRSDNLLVRVIKFDRDVQEWHGWKELNKCDLSSYDLILQKLGGSTALFDAGVDLANSIEVYGKELSSNDYSVNALAVLITDGLNNSGVYGPKQIREHFDNSVGEGKLESLTKILIGVNINDPQVSQELKYLKKEAGFDKYVELDNANPKTIAKLAEFISKSISSVSKSLNTGSAPAPQSLTF